MASLANAESTVSLPHKTSEGRSQCFVRKIQYVRNANALQESCDVLRGSGTGLSALAREAKLAYLIQ